MRIKDTWIVKTMDNIAETVCDCSQTIGELLLNFAKIIMYIALLVTAGVWAVPYIILKRIEECRKRRRGEVYEPAAEQSERT